MKKKHLLFNGLFFLFAGISPACAQSTQPVSEPSVHPGVLEPSRFVDNWYIEAGGGFQMLFADDVTRLNFKERLTPSVTLTLGKWFSPRWGLRLQAGGWSLHGYNGIKGNYIGDPLDGMEGAYGPNDPAKDHHAISGDGTYRQNLRYANIHADFQFSVANLCGGYNPHRRFDLIPAVGLGYTRVIAHAGIPSANVLSAHFALMAKARLARRLDLNLEASAAVLPERFDGRISDGKAYASTLGLTLGLTWRLGKTGFRPLHCDYYDQLQAAQSALRESRKNAAAWKVRASAKPRELVREVVKTEAVGLPFVLSSVPFRSDHYQVTEREHEPALSQVASYLSKNEKTIAVLKGYADRQTGYPEYNRRVAEKRVQAVAHYLEQQYGVNPQRLRLEVYGDTEQPYTTNRWNRAVVIEIVSAETE